VVTRQLQVELRTAKERWPETDVLLLSQIASNMLDFCFENIFDAINRMLC